jgi:hypothetical protein
MFGKKSQLQQVYNGLEAGFPGLFVHVDAPPPVNSPAVGADLTSGGVCFLFISDGDWTILRGDTREFVPIRAVDGSKPCVFRLMLQLVDVWLTDWRRAITKMNYPPSILETIQTFGQKAEGRRHAAAAYSFIKEVAEGESLASADAKAYAIVALRDLENPPTSFENLLERF